MDVVPWTLAELRDRLRRGDRFARTIVAEGERLLDRYLARLGSQPAGLRTRPVARPGA